MTDRPFLDSNCVIYAFTYAGAKTEKARILLNSEGIVSLQVLNETANTLNRKFAVDWVRIGQIVQEILIHCPNPRDLNLNTHRRALQVCERYRYSFYDGLIVASALEADCRVLYTEDLQHGQVIEGLRIENPFLKI
jgi:predicted nucleic acid-binding protein